MALEKYSRSNLAVALLYDAAFILLLVGRVCDTTVTRIEGCLRNGSAAKGSGHVGVLSTVSVGYVQQWRTMCIQSSPPSSHGTSRFCYVINAHRINLSFPSAQW
jgi:hypothetical protein